MKILQLIHKNQPRGAEIFTSQLSTHLISLGHEVKIVALFKGEVNLPFDDEIECINASSKRRFIDLKGWQRLAHIIHVYQPRIVQANAGDTLKYAVLSKQFFGWKVPILFRNASEVGRYLSSNLQKSFNAYLYKKVDRVASVSRASEKDMISNFPFLKGKTEVIPIGLEEKDEISPVKFNPGSVKHILHVGGFSFEKNHMGLLQIFKMVLERREKVLLHLVGDGPLRPDVALAAEKMGLSPYVHFHGFVDNPLAYIKSANVLVLPSIIEGLPGVLLEAMYCETPVVAYNVGGISEIVKNNETGYLIVKNDLVAFAEAVIKAIEEDEPTYLQNAKKMVHKIYMNDQIALKFVNSYLKLVEGGE